MSSLHRWKLIASLLLLALLAVAALFYFRLVWFVYPDRAAYPTRGIDISRYQGQIDWDKVAKDDVSFAFIKATEADDLQDESFIKNAAGAHKTGIKVGAYHFYSLRYGGEVQAKNFIAAVATSSIQFPPVIDLEYVGNSKVRPSKADFQKELGIYIDLVSRQYNSQPILYTTYEFYNDYLYPEYKDSPIWIRDIFSKPDKSIGNLVLWQYNPRGRVEGIESAVDLDVFNGSSGNEMAGK